jgi:hypothetical protein
VNVAENQKGETLQELALRTALIRLRRKLTATPTYPFHPWTPRESIIQPPEQVENDH